MTPFELMREYLKLKLAQEDWHGVADAAMDIREILAGSSNGRTGDSESRNAGSIPAPAASKPNHELTQAIHELAKWGIIVTEVRLNNLISFERFCAASGFGPSYRTSSSEVKMCTAMGEVLVWF